MNKRILAVVAALVLVASGASAKKVKTLKAGDKSIDSEYWTDSDIRMVCNYLIKQCGESDNIKGFIEDNGRPPRVKIEQIDNKTGSDGRVQENLNTRIMENFFKNAVINNRNLTIMADDKQREKLQEERMWQKENADEDSLQEGDALAADYELLGTVELNYTPEKPKKNEWVEKSYVVTLQLINVTTQESIASFQNDTEETAVKKLVKAK